MNSQEVTGSRLAPSASIHGRSHTLWNAGIRLSAADHTIAYTGDSGPSPDLAILAQGADLYLAEATFLEQVPADSTHYLSSAIQAAQVAAQASDRQLMLTHLWPGTDPGAARLAASRAFDGPITVARAGLVVDLDDPDELPRRTFEGSTGDQGGSF
jgi:ribonuclease BN (tRNA processing enzyme)